MATNLKTLRRHHNRLPPTHGAMTMMEIDENDAAARPFNSVEFEDKSKLKIEVEDKSTDEDDGPPLPQDISGGMLVKLLIYESNVLGSFIIQQKFIFLEHVVGDERKRNVQRGNFVQPESVCKGR